MRPALPALLVAGALAGACKVPDPPAITAPWRDDFERAGLGGDYLATQDAYAVRGGALNARGAYNHPLWLRRKLPRDAAIELDAWSTSPDGDIKVEAWGDGESHAHDRGAYAATGYVFVMGGWGNARSILARREEHAPGTPGRALPRVEPGRHYHWKIVRKGGRVDWFVDDTTTAFLSLDDPHPLEGRGHDYFGFNNWESDLWFDNLSITPAP